MLMAGHWIGGEGTPLSTLYFFLLFVVRLYVIRLYSDQTQCSNVKLQLRITCIKNNFLLQGAYFIHFVSISIL